MFAEFSVRLFRAAQNTRSVPPELPMPSDVTKDLENLYRSGKHADFTLVVEERELKAHKAILAARSPVFAAMMEPHTAEAQNSRAILRDIDYEVVQAILYYIYTGTCTNMGGNALDILAAAERFALPGLKNIAEVVSKKWCAHRFFIVFISILKIIGNEKRAGYRDSM